MVAAGAAALMASRRGRGRRSLLGPRASPASPAWPGSFTALRPSHPIADAMGPRIRVPGPLGRGPLRSLSPPTPAFGGRVWQ
jgi:hypothetical protein